MNIVVDIPQRFAGKPSVALAHTLDAAHDEDTIVAHLHRPFPDIQTEALNDEIDVLTAFLSESRVSFTMCPVVTNPDVASSLLDCARHWDAGLLVVEFPTKPLGGTVLGKQAQRLILEAPCSVLIAR